MKKYGRKLIAVFLGTVMTLSVMAFSVQAADLSAITQKKSIGLTVSEQAIHIFNQLSFKDYNSFEPEEPVTVSTLQDGRTAYYNVKYASLYPNSFLDIYQPAGALKQRPVCLYVHGGGYVWGNKNDDTPADPEQGIGEMFKAFNDLGVTVVSINYALAPEYTYPTPIYQIDEAVNFLKQNSAKYGLDMSKIYMMGGSAGGQLIGQYANIQTNDEYAKEMSMGQSLGHGTIRNMVMFGPLLDVESFGETGDRDPLFDALFAACGNCYFQTDTAKGNKQAIQAGVLNHLTKDFPACYISDGNHGTFNKQAEELDRRLTELGVPHQTRLLPKTQGIHGHGYEYQNDTAGKQARQAAIQYLRENVK